MITLKSFSELASVLDLDSLEPGPSELDDTSLNVEHPVTPAEVNHHGSIGEADSSTTLAIDLAGVMAELAHVSTDLESLARADARAREQASLELAQYETLVAERRQAESALAEAGTIRTAAEQLLARAFTEDARAQAAQHAAAARAAELACTQVLAQRIRSADELSSRPHLARVLADRERHEQEQAEASERFERDRVARLSSGLVAAKEARSQGRLEEARNLLVTLARSFPDDTEIRSSLDAVRWQIQHLRAAPAENALNAVLRRPYGDDPRAALDCLAALDMHGLPEQLARRVFGVWSRICLMLVRQESMHDPRRYSSETSRGLIFARHSPEAAYMVISALGLSGWQVGDEIKDQRIIDASRPLTDR
ncbi:MAG: hypothetical protein JOY61_05780 [Chloroflexi bacterium]|nr:hypothetical protein [Chloroflexota bacterium]